MKLIPLTQGYVTQVDDEDYEWLSVNNWYAHVKPANPKHRRRTPIPYAVRKAKGHMISMAEEVIFKHGLLVAAKFVDHVDGNRLNNQKWNLRNATPAQNQQNQMPRKHSSRFKGVSWDSKGRVWTARIRNNLKQFYLGSFSIEEEAARVYDAAARNLFGQYAKPNFI